MKSIRASLMSVAVGLVLGTCLVVWGCSTKKRTYTIPEVTKEINTAINKTERLKRQGELIKAAKTLNAITAKVMNEFPEATLTQEPIKKLVLTLQWLANLCLDRALELKQEAVTDAQEDQSANLRKWSDQQKKWATQLRDKIPNLKKAEVAARRAPPRPTPMRPAPTPGERPADMRPTGPSPTQPSPEEPREPAGAESGSMEPS